MLVSVLVHASDRAATCFGRIILYTSSVCLINGGRLKARKDLDSAKCSNATHNQSPGDRNTGLDRLWEMMLRPYEMILAISVHTRAIESPHNGRNRELQSSMPAGPSNM